MDFDPSVVTFGQLLNVFWAAHTPTAPRWNVQYKAAIFFHDEEQRSAAEESTGQRARQLSSPITTATLAYSRFYRAEDYHQKFRLRRHAEWTLELEAIYPDPNDFTDSTTAAKLNGLLAGYTVHPASR